MTGRQRCVIRFRRCTWHLYEPPHISTVFWDGLRVEAAPDHARDLPTARRYRYGDDTVRLWLHHDLTHCWLMERLGYAYSPTLRNVVEPGMAGHFFRAAEEAAVLDFQAYCRGGPRPVFALMLYRPAGPRPDAWTLRRSFGRLLTRYALL